MKKISVGSNRLSQLSLGYVNEFCDYGGVLLSLLAEHQSSSLEVVHVCSIKENPGSYLLYDSPSTSIQRLVHLKELGIDYDYLTNEMMCVLAEPGRLSLYKLTLNIHRLNPHNHPLTDDMWDNLVKTSPSLKVTLNFIHSIEGAWHIMDIIRPSMPLAHFRLLFSQYVNGDALIHLSQYSNRVLESIYIVDSVDGSLNPHMYSMTGNEDPFVMMAWKCHNLKRLTVIGKRSTHDLFYVLGW